MSGLGKIDVGDKNETVHYFHCHESGVNHVFVDNPMFLQKVWGMAGGKIYDSVASTDNHDTQLCFSVFVLGCSRDTQDCEVSQPARFRTICRSTTFHGSDKNGGGKNVDLWSLIGMAIAGAASGVRPPLLHGSYGENYNTGNDCSACCLDSLEDEVNLGPMPIGLKVSSMGSMTVRSALRFTPELSHLL